ncbi:hypothetical protein BVC93_16535 [Mycobacterium sp. MS1601]|nr:hypothetical protein BVC93_16535 [Mycobacterium sp. MS1601]
MIPVDAVELLSGLNCGVLSTAGTGGRVQSSVVWVAHEAGIPVFSTIEGRLKTRNIRSNPNVSLLVHAVDNPYRYLEVRGRVDFSIDDDNALINSLAMRYLGQPVYTADATGAKRLKGVLHPEKVVWKAA